MSGGVSLPCYSGSLARKNGVCYVVDISKEARANILWTFSYFMYSLRLILSDSNLPKYGCIYV